jgi:hypothetical protein
MWHAVEPIHAAVYFAPEAKDLYAEAGLKGYWMGYFASRAAAFGEASAELVMATFYNFAEHMVRRAIPDAWKFSTPARVLEARYRVADVTTSRFCGDVNAPAVLEAAGIAERIARAARPEGRPLFAAHAALPWPDEPHLRLWHAATLLREHRGDAHVALLLGYGIDGTEAHVISAAAKRVDPAWQRQHRGLSDQEWGAAEERLLARGILDSDAAFTARGEALKRSIEDLTDERAVEPYAEIGEEACVRLRSLIESLATGDEVPYPNAMGLTR